MSEEEQRARGQREEGSFSSEGQTFEEQALRALEVLRSEDNLVAQIRLGSGALVEGLVRSFQNDQIEIQEGDGTSSFFRFDDLVALRGLQVQRVVFLHRREVTPEVALPERVISQAPFFEMWIRTILEDRSRELQVYRRAQLSL